MKENISFLNEDETFENTFEIHFTEKYNDIKCLPDSSSLNLLIMPTREASPMDDGSMITTMAWHTSAWFMRHHRRPLRGGQRKAGHVSLHNSIFFKYTIPGRSSPIEHFKSTGLRHRQRLIYLM